ncbi:NTP transferase domain-containing protein [Sphingomonas natans]|uniref:NTP transferase domain-containing protein n=1 Tax=Sphingomonas natans TaxID=3063330 RepID=UPI003D6666D3
MHLNPSPRVIILAAGRGTQRGNITTDGPKCLVEIGGRPGIEWQLDALHAAGIRNVTSSPGSMPKESRRDFRSVPASRRCTIPSSQCPMISHRSGLRAICWMEMRCRSKATPLFSSQPSRLCCATLETVLPSPSTRRRYTMQRT